MVLGLVPESDTLYLLRGCVHDTNLVESKSVQILREKETVMKRILLLTAIGALLSAVPGFTDDPNPPGQAPDKVILITIDESAIPGHLGHIGDHNVPAPDVSLCSGGGGGGG